MPKSPEQAIDAIFNQLEDVKWTEIAESKMFKDSDSEYRNRVRAAYLKKVQGSERWQNADNDQRIAFTENVYSPVGVGEHVLSGLQAVAQNNPVISPLLYGPDSTAAALSSVGHQLDELRKATPQDPALANQMLLDLQADPIAGAQVSMSPFHQQMARQLAEQGVDPYSQLKTASHAVESKAEDIRPETQTPMGKVTGAVSGGVMEVPALSLWTSMPAGFGLKGMYDAWEPEHDMEGQKGRIAKGGLFGLAMDAVFKFAHGLPFEKKAATLGIGGATTSVGSQIDYTALANGDKEKAFENVNFEQAGADSVSMIIMGMALGGDAESMPKELRGIASKVDMNRGHESLVELRKQVSKAMSKEELAQAGRQFVEESAKQPEVVQEIQKVFSSPEEVTARVKAKEAESQQAFKKALDEPVSVEARVEKRNKLVQNMNRQFDTKGTKIDRSMPVRFGSADLLIGGKDGKGYLHQETIGRGGAFEDAAGRSDAEPSAYLLKDAKQAFSVPGDPKRTPVAVFAKESHVTGGDPATNAVKLSSRTPVDELLFMVGDDPRVFTAKELREQLGERDVQGRENAGRVESVPEQPTGEQRVQNEVPGIEKDGRTQDTILDTYRKIQEEIPARSVREERIDAESLTDQDKAELAYMLEELKTGKPKRKHGKPGYRPEEEGGQTFSGGDLPEWFQGNKGHTREHVVPAIRNALGMTKNKLTEKQAATVEMILRERYNEIDKLNDLEKARDQRKDTVFEKESEAYNARVAQAYKSIMDEPELFLNSGAPFDLDASTQKALGRLKDSISPSDRMRPEYRAHMKSVSESMKNIVKRYMGNREERWASIFEDNPEAGKKIARAIEVAELSRRVAQAKVTREANEMAKKLPEKDRKLLTHVLEGIPDGAVKDGKVTKFGAKVRAGVKILEKGETPPPVGTILNDGRIVGEMVGDKTIQLYDYISEQTAKQRYDDLIARNPYANEVIAKFREGTGEEPGKLQFTDVKDIPFAEPDVRKRFNIETSRGEGEAYVPDVSDPASISGKFTAAFKMFNAGARQRKSGSLRTGESGRTRSEDFIKNWHKRRVEFIHEEIKNNMTATMFQVGAQRIPESGLPAGYTEVSNIVKKLPPPQQIKILENHPELAEMLRAKITTDKAGKKVVEYGTGQKYMIPNAMGKELERESFVPKDREFTEDKTYEMTRAVDEAIGSTLNLMNKAMLARPSTTMRNVVSGNIQMAHRTVEKFWRGVADSMRGEGPAAWDAFVGEMMTKFRTLPGVESIKPTQVPRELLGDIFATQIKGAGDKPNLTDYIMVPFSEVEIWQKRRMYSAVLNSEARAAFRKEVKAGRLNPSDKKAFFEAFVDGHIDEPIIHKAYTEAGTYNFNYENKPAFIRKMQKSKIGRAAAPFPNYIYHYTRLAGRYLNPKNLLFMSPHVTPEVRAERFAKLMTAATMYGVAYAVVDATWDKKQAQIRKHKGALDYDVSTRGRLKIYEDDGTEYWLRVADIPALGDMLAYKMWMEDDISFAEYFMQRMSVGPIANSLLSLIGYSGEYDKWKPKGAVVGKNVALLNPLTAHLSYIARSNDKYLRKYYDPNAGFWQNFMLAIMDDIPGLRQQLPVRKDRRGEPIELQPTAEAFKFWILNILPIDKVEKQMQEEDAQRRIADREGNK